jgi:hypothetical protein
MQSDKDVFPLLTDLKIIVTCNYEARRRVSRCVESSVGKMLTLSGLAEAPTHQRCKEDMPRSRYCPGGRCVVECPVTKCSA